MQKNITISYILSAIIFGLTIQFHFVSMFFTMILTYLLINKLNSFLIKIIHSCKFTKTISICLVGLFIGAFVFGAVESACLIKESFSPIMNKLITFTLELFSILPLTIREYLPLDLNELKSSLAHLAALHKENLLLVTVNTFKFVSHCLVGLILGIILSFNHLSNLPVFKEDNTLVQQMKLRFLGFLNIFEKIYFSQGKISLINSAFTGIYLFIALPIFGYKIPYSGYLLFLTFVFGLIPVVGNLISNSLIILFSFSIGLPIAISSLVFLIIIHKLEYYINSAIIGKVINLNLFEIILAMVVFESMLGLKGLFLATLIFGYVKSELKIQKII